MTDKAEHRVAEKVAAGVAETADAIAAAAAADTEAEAAAMAAAAEGEGTHDRRCRTVGQRVEQQCEESWWEEQRPEEQWREGLRECGDTESASAGTECGDTECGVP